MKPLPPHDQRHLWLHYQVVGYIKEILYDFKQRLETIFDRQVNRVHILDFEGLTLDIRQDLAERMRMVYTGEDGQESILALGVHTVEKMAEDGFGAYWDFLRGAPSYTYIRDLVRRLCHRLISYSILRRGQAPEKVTATDLFYLCSMDRGAANIPYLLAKYFFKKAEGRKSSDRLSGGHFIRRLAHHFGMVSDDRLRGLSVVASGQERQHVATAGALEAKEDTLQSMKRLERIKEEIQGLRMDFKSLRGLVKSLMTNQGRVSTWMISCMTQLIEASRQTYQVFDGTFRGSFLAIFERRTRQRTSEANTSTALQHPDP
nr:hypothetical protein [Tanacetum cinerariifolium]